MKALLIAEKPSLMRDILAVYNTMAMKDVIDFMAFAGHTMTLAQPGDYKAQWGVKKWNWDMLPIVPDKFKCNISDGKEKLYNDIKNKLNTGNYDYVINACDPDREGQAIFEYFIEHVGCKLPVKRFWTNDLTEKSIEKALSNLRDNHEPFLKNLTTASKLRGQFDWLVGMNLTVASSLQMKNTVKVGRVKTPTLKIIVDRELEITNFKPTNFYELEGIFSGYNGVYFDKDGIVRFSKKEDADNIINKLKKDSVVESIEKKMETNYAPQLYSLSSLQTDASKLFGYTAEETKTFVQSLYEKKILSYPRTDNPYISTELAKNFPKMLKAVYKVDGLNSYVKNILSNTKAQTDVAKNKRYVNDAKMAESGHYAIVPTGIEPDFTKLSKNELNIFSTVAKRFVAIFLPPMKIFKTTIVTNNNSYLFKTNGKTLIDEGYSVLYNYKTVDILLPELKKGDKVDLIETKLNEKVTTPPQRYTDGTLISVMENPVKFLLDEGLKTTIKENKGIGTTATRDNIIGELVSNGYIERKKNKGKMEYIYATEKGISIIQNLKDKDISSIDLTGIWEENLGKIENGEMNSEEFRTLMINYVLKSINDIKSSNMSTVFNQEGLKTIGKCPKCGRDVIESHKYYLCSSYKEDCDFIIGKTFFGAKITNKDAEKILKGEHTRKMNFKFKNGKNGSGKLTYNAKEGRVNIIFENEEPKEKKEIGKCPKCGEKIIDGNKYYICSKYKDTCDFIIGKEILGENITIADIKALIANKETSEKNFTWKSGKKGKAKLKLNDKYGIDFIFNN